MLCTRNDQAKVILNQLQMNPQSFIIYFSISHQAHTNRSYLLCNCMDQTLPCKYEHVSGYSQGDCCMSEWRQCTALFSKFLILQITMCLPKVQNQNLRPTAATWFLLILATNELQHMIWESGGAIPRLQNPTWACCTEACQNKHISNTAYSRQTAKRSI